MSQFIPFNALDKAIMAFARSRAALPDLCRCLREGDLYLLVPFHPEIANEDMELKNGQPFPFVQLKSEHGAVVPVFSSEERVSEGLERGKVPPRTYLPAIMPAPQVLEILGKMNLKMTLNKGCATGEITLPPNLLRDLADGTALKPLGMGAEKTEELRLDIVGPADYPAELVQAVFEVFRRHREFRAAWIFTRTLAGQPKPAHCPYYLLVLMEPRDERIFHDFNLVAQSARGKHELNLSLANEQDREYVAGLFQQARPFYVAAEDRPPAPGSSGSP